MATFTAITWRFDYSNSRQRVEEEAARPRPSPRRWKTSYFNDEVFRKALCRERNLLGLSGDELVAVLSRACDATRRRMQRALTEQDRNKRRVVFAAAKVALKTEIKQKPR